MDLSGNLNNIIMSKIFIFIYLISMALSCNDKVKKNSSKHKSNIEVTDKYVNKVIISKKPHKDIFSFGEKMPIKLSVEDSYTVDSVNVAFNGVLIGKHKTLSEIKEIIIPNSKVGYCNIVFTSFHPNNEQSVNSLSFDVLPTKPPKRLQYKVLTTHTHDKEAYTQGLVYHNGFIYEGTGLREGKSSLRKIDLKNGNILSLLNLDSKYFGEGITVYNDKIYQLTWTSNKGFVYDINTFSLESTFHYSSEGWGLTTKGKEVIMSDGSNRIYVVDPTNFGIKKQIEVFDNNGRVDSINELEFAKGLLWANIWLKNRIVGIDLDTGVVVKDLDLSSILTKKEWMKLDENDDVLNGIAYNEKDDVFYVTGKRWPKLFEIKISE